MGFAQSPRLLCSITNEERGACVAWVHRGVDTDRGYDASRPSGWVVNEPAAVFAERPSGLPIKVGGGGFARHGAARARKTVFS